MIRRLVEGIELLAREVGRLALALSWKEPPDGSLARIEGKLDVAITQGVTMGQRLEELREEVAEIKTVAASAERALDGLKARIDEIIANGAKAEDLQALSSELDTTSKGLAAAIERNPADPPPPGA